MVCREPLRRLEERSEWPLEWRMDVAHVSPFGTAWMKNRAKDIKKFKYGQWVLFNHVSGHRDANYTACPGDLLYGQLPTIRKAAYSIGPPRTHATTYPPAT